MRTGWVVIRRFALPVLLAGQFVANVDTAIANLALPSIRATLHASAAELQLVVAGYVLPYAALLVIGARSGTLYGHRRFFLGGLALFVIASLGCGLAPTAAILIACRLAQGVGAACMVPQVLTGIQASTQGGARARALAWYTVTLSGSAVVGQLLGGIVVSANLFGASWRPVFLINVPIGLALFAAALVALPPDAPGRDEPPDLAGAALLFASLVLAIVPLTLGREAGWPLWALAALVASVPLLVAFVRRQLRLERDGRHPLLDVAHLTSRRIGSGLIALGASSATYFSMLFVVALYLQEGLHESARASGATLVAWVAAYGCAGPALARWRGPSREAASTIGCTLMALAFAGVGAWAAAGRGDGLVFALLLSCGGFGFGISSTALRMRVTAGSAGRHAADLSGAISTTAQLAAVAGIATFGSAYVALAPHAGAAAAFGIVAGTFACTTAAAAVTAAVGMSPS